MSYLYTVIREAYTEDFGKSQTKKITGKFQIDLFRDTFFEELNLREVFGRTGFVPAKSVTRLTPMLKALADRLAEDAARWNVNPVNLMFLVLNRYAAMFLRARPLGWLASYYDEFTVELAHDPELLGLMNYDTARRRLTIGIIRELQEAKDSPALAKFLKGRCGGFKVNFPEHFAERSWLFEAVLRMVAQIEADPGLGWYMQVHAIEILKAHIHVLRDHGNPVKLKLGHLHGENAMKRLRTWLPAAPGRAQSRFKGVEL